MRIQVLLAATLILQPPRTPNVVLVMMDDMGYGDLGSYGAPDVRTPNIDRLAREGVRLTDAYANGAVCTATRAALISGRYQQRAGLEWVLTGSAEDRQRGLPVTGTSLPALLKTNGYATGLARQVASRLETGVRAERPRIRRVLRVPERRPRLLLQRLRWSTRSLRERNTGRALGVPDR